MKLGIVFLAVFAMIFSACDTQSPLGSQLEDSPQAQLSARSSKRAANNPKAQFIAIMDATNIGLAKEGADYRVTMVEYVTGAGAQEAGATVISKNLGNKQLLFDFVPGDPRRVWSGPADDITYAIDQTNDAVPPIGGLNATQTTEAIVSAHATWEDLDCSILSQLQNPDFGFDIGVVAFLNGLGGSGFVFADIQHAGWRDIDFVDGVLGATFTFGFVDDEGNFTDIDNNARLDAAFREVYYDPSYNWADDGATDFDVEAVALHEIGHGLSQAHFGNIFIKNDGSLKRSPAAVMNPFILDQTRDLLGSDVSGHCSIWSSWPRI